MQLPKEEHQKSRSHLRGTELLFSFLLLECPKCIKELLSSSLYIGFLDGKNEETAERRIQRVGAHLAKLSMSQETALVMEARSLAPSRASGSLSQDGWPTEVVSDIVNRSGTLPSPWFSEIVSFHTIL